MEIRNLVGSTSVPHLISERNTSSEPGNTVQKTASATLQTVDAIQKTNQPEQVTDTEKLAKAVDDINKTIKNFSQNLEFSLDEQSKRVIVKLVDQQTKEVLRQIPSEETLEIAKSLDKLKGLLIHQQA